MIFQMIKNCSNKGWSVQMQYIFILNENKDTSVYIVDQPSTLQF